MTPPNEHLGPNIIAEQKLHDKMLSVQLWQRNLGIFDGLDDSENVVVLCRYGADLKHQFSLVNVGEARGYAKLKLQTFAEDANSELPYDDEALGEEWSLAPEVSPTHSQVRKMTFQILKGTA